jgi:hypothetical protein
MCPTERNKVQYLAGDCTCCFRWVYRIGRLRVLKLPASGGRACSVGVSDTHLSRPALLELFDHLLEIGIAGAKPSCQPVPTALSDHLAVRDHVKLTGLARCGDRLDAKPLLDKGHETRDLGSVIVSSGAVNDFDLHLASISCVQHTAGHAAVVDGIVSYVLGCQALASSPALNPPEICWVVA